MEHGTELTPYTPDGSKVSTRLTRKGPLIEETYRAFQSWDTTASVSANLERVTTSNVFGARNQSWLHEVTATISSRFGKGEAIAPLAALAKAGLPIEIWRDCLLWHTARRDALYYRFATEWLYQAYQEQRRLIRTEDVAPFIEMVTRGKLARGQTLSEYGRLRTARDLLLAASDFGILEGRNSREFTHFHIPESVFLYAAHAIAETEGNPRRLLDSPDWRLYLLSPTAVEREFHDLHQYRKVSFDIAGSLVHLELPCGSLIEYAAMLAKECRHDV